MTQHRAVLTAAGGPALGEMLPTHAEPGEEREIGRLNLLDRPCRVVCVDEVIPRHVAARHGPPRLLYAEGELAHFEIDGHVFAVVAEGAEEPSPEAGEAPGEPKDVRELLTNRELQIVQLICMGCLTKQVADRLSISEFTVRSYLKTVYCKLGVRSRGALVFRYAQAFQRNAARAGLDLVAERR